MGNATPSGDLPTAVRQAMRLLGGGDLVSAEAQALEILRAVPGEPNAEFILAAIRRTRGDAEGARQALITLLRQAPAFALATQELGFALLDLGLIEEAVTALHDAVKTEPALAPSWKALAEIEGARGNAELAAEAASRFALARATDPRLVEATELFRKGNTPAAERACRAYLHDQPTDVSAIRLLADIGTRLGMLQDAENLLARCLELAPDFTLARLNYAQVLSKRENLPAALAQVDLLLAAEPNRFPFLVLRASILVKMGEFEKGIRAYEQLTDTFGPRPMVTLVHGHALKTVGRQEEAIAAYRKTIELNPCFGDAYWSLANLKTFRFEDADISAMRSQLASDQPSLEDHFHLCFALGKALEDRGEFEESFACYQRGNAIKSRLEKHDEAELAREVERNIVVCTRQFFESRRGSGCPAPDPIFIVGLPRSGSTLLEQILASHSKEDGTKELIDIPAIVRRLGGRRRKGEPSRYPDILGSLDAGQLLQLGEEYLERARVQRG
ncbi:MAG: tetratricopeptide repeat protein, partial [Steroidobacteraceae bacterium]